MGQPEPSLLQEINEIFPPVNPNPEDSLSKIMYKSGQRSVVEWITERLQNNEL